MTDYYLSKRTDIYAGVAWQHEQSPDRGACGDASRVLTGRKKWLGDLIADTFGSCGLGGKGDAFQYRLRDG